MRIKFLINIAFLIGLNLLIKPFWIFGIDRSIQNITGNEAYGLFASLLGFSFIFQFVLDVGITNYNNQNLAQNGDFIRSNFSRLASLKLVLALAYSAITLFAALVLGYEGKAIHLLIFLCLNQFLLSYILFLRSNISGLQIFWLDSILSILDRVVLITICSLLLWSKYAPGPFQIEWMVYAQSFSYGVTLLTSFVIVFYHSRSILSIPDWSFIRSTLRKSLPFALIIFFMNLYFRVDSVMIERILPEGEYQAGLYAQSYRFLDMINNFIFLFISILFPLMSRELSKGQSIDKLLQLTLQLLGLPVLFLVGIALFFSEELIQLSYTDSNSHSATVLSILLISYLPLFVSQIYGTVLTAGVHLSTMLRWTGIAFVINIVLNAVLIPIYGIVGAAVASLAAQSFMSLACFWACQQKFELNLPWRWMLIYAASSILTLILVNRFVEEMQLLTALIVLIGANGVLGMVFIYRHYVEFKLLRRP